MLSRYISTPYDEQRRRNAQENREQRRSAQGDTNGRRSASPLRPFKPSSPPKFGKAGYPGLTLAPVPGIVGEYVYMELGVEKASKKVRVRGRRAGEAKAAARPPTAAPVLTSRALDDRGSQDAFPTPFWPSHPAKSGGHATLNKFPKVRARAHSHHRRRRVAPLTIRAPRPRCPRTTSRIRWTRSSSRSRRRSCRSCASCRCVMRRSGRTAAPVGADGAPGPGARAAAL